MRLLYLTAGFPYPLTSGYLRHYHFIKGLSQYHKIVLLSIVGPTFKPGHMDELKPYTEQIIPIRNTTAGKRDIYYRVVKRVHNLFSINPAIGEMRESLKSLLQTERYDAIVLSGEYNIDVIKGLDTPPVIADMCDAKSDRVRKRITSSNSLFWKLMLQVKLWEMQRVERNVIHKANSVLFASERDIRIVPAEARQRSFVVSNGVDTDYWRRQVPALGTRTLIFTGAMHFPPNYDAALYLIREILPGIRRQVPDVKLLIVGHSPTTQLIEAGRQPGVTITGFVDDMRTYLEKATVFVSPLRYGSGIQNKLLEAMAMELPIVTSSVGGDGVRVDGLEPPFSIADDTETFVRYTVDLLRRYDANLNPPHEARKYVESHFTWSRNIQRLNEIIMAVQ